MHGCTSHAMAYCRHLGSSLCWDNIAKRHPRGAECRVMVCSVAIPGPQVCVKDAAITVSHANFSTASSVLLQWAGSSLLPDVSWAMTQRSFSSASSMASGWCSRSLLWVLLRRTYRDVVSRVVSFRPSVRKCPARQGKPERPVHLRSTLRSY